MTERGRRLLSGLREAETYYQSQTPHARADARFRSAIDGSLPTSWLRPAVLALAGVAALCLALGLRWLHSEPTQPRSITLNGFKAESACMVAATHVAGAIETLGRCKLAPNERTGIRIDAAPGTVLSTRADGVEVRRGRAEFDVTPVERGQMPVRVRVSGGIITVMGTRFEVEDGSEGGSVALEVGHILFTDSDGAERDLFPGDRHTWSSRATAPSIKTIPPPAVSAQPEPRASRDESGREGDRSGAAADMTASNRLDRIASLRQAGRYVEAASLLRDWVARARTVREAEVLGYELGDVMSRSDVPPRICAYWTKYQKRFPRGRYDAEVTETKKRLGCD